MFQHTEGERGPQTQMEHRRAVEQTMRWQLRAQPPIAPPGFLTAFPSSVPLGHSSLSVARAGLCSIAAQRTFRPESTLVVDLPVDSLPVLLSVSPLVRGDG